MLSAVAIICVLGLLIAFHELGHFLVAKLVGVGVQTFCLGFGPKLFRVKWGQTDFSLAAIPLGGYVRLVGESNEDDELPPGFTPRQSYMKRPPWHRMAIVLAGPIFNFVLAVLLYWLLFWSQGVYELKAVVGKVTPDMPAQAAGIEPGDRILAIDDQPIEYWDDLAATVSASKGRALVLTLARGERTFSVTVTPQVMTVKNLFGEDVESAKIGVMASGETVAIPLGPGEAASQATDKSWQVISLTFQTFLKLLQRVVPFDAVGGPIMIAQLVSEQAKEGLGNLVALTAFISINLGVVNLLPIPVMDGGLLVFYCVELILGRPVNRRIQEITTRIGLALIITLMFLAIFNDLQRLFKWPSLL